SSPTCCARSSASRQGYRSSTWSITRGDISARCATLSPRERGEGGERPPARLRAFSKRYGREPGEGQFASALAALGPPSPRSRGERAQAEFAARAECPLGLCISAACGSPAAPSCIPTQNDSGPLKDFARPRGHTRCCGPACGVPERRDGRWEPAILL